MKKDKIELFKEYASRFRINETETDDTNVFICHDIVEVSCIICPYFNNNDKACKQNITIDELNELKVMFPEYFI